MKNHLEMSRLTNGEKEGLQHLFSSQGTDLSLQLARNVTKNTMQISPEEALDIILLHSTSCRILLNKRCVTRELLFKYLHQNRIPVRDDFSKASLIDKTIEFWNQTSYETSSSSQSMPQVCFDNNQIIEYEYPIQVMAREFTQWFYERLNSNSLSVSDFWADSRLDMRIIINDTHNDQEVITNQLVIDTLIRTKIQYDIFFNPNMSNDGVQGRMDVHGLVLILSCGTIHSIDKCVGIFESTFGMMRDPYAENNWKMKTVKMLLRNTSADMTPSLSQSENFTELLDLPMPTGNIG